MGPSNSENTRALLRQREDLKRALEDAEAEIARLRVELFKHRLERIGPNRFASSLEANGR